VSSRNAPLGDAMVVVVVGAAVVVVGGATVVLPQTNEPSGEPAPQESQQLGAVPAHAWPPFGAFHWLSFDLVEHVTLPRRSTRQQVTAPGLPHVDLAAQLVTTPLHWFGRSSPFNAFVTQLTY